MSADDHGNADIQEQDGEGEDVGGLEDQRRGAGYLRGSVVRYNVASESQLWQYVNPLA